MSAGASLNSPAPSTTALPSVFKVLTFGGAGGVQFTDDLHACNLSWLNLWCLQTGGAGLITVTVQFADGAAPGGAPAFMPLVPDFGILLNVPSLTNYHLGCRRYRIGFTSTGVAVVRYHATASL